jgi:hypothetical protein
VKTKNPSPQKENTKTKGETISKEGCSIKNSKASPTTPVKYAVVGRIKGA